MALLLGIDTGGTFTDAALLETADGAVGEVSKSRVVAKAKALTTRHDFAIGIAEAAKAAITELDCKPEAIGLVSLSTTLATNALVEGQGGRVALVAIGFEERDLKNAGLAEAVGSDPVVILPGGHTTHGSQAQPLDTTLLLEQLNDLAEQVTGFAVAGYFAVRNPEHELAVRDLIFEKTGKPVTCSHELSARLNGPKRALTTVLNARLVPMITRLIDATKRTLSEANISAPLMIVRGDGALVGADFAVRRPIETILSGPAASLVGARFLTGVDRAFVNDIGGTTSDVAILENGQPKLDPDGARVGGFRTMVEAVAMHTFGLGGDSEITLGGSALKPQIDLGPRRLVPISLIASKHGTIVHEALDRQLKGVLNGRHDGRFAMRTGAGLQSDLSANDQRLYDKLGDVPQPLEGFLDGMAQAAALNRLVGSGLVQIGGLTPSDAMHATERHSIWDKEAAIKALRLFGRQRDGGGKHFCDDPMDLAEMIIKRVQRRSAEVVLETAFHIDGRDGSETLAHPLVQNVLNRRESLEPGDHQTVDFSITLDRPLIGLGASAHAYHPQAATLLGTSAIIPEDAGVANAIGAVVGQIAVKVEVVITQPGEGRFQVTGVEAPFADEQAAMDAAEKLAHERADQLAKDAGAGVFEIDLERTVKRAMIESRDMLIECRITAIATGRPPIASLASDAKMPI